MKKHLCSVIYILLIVAVCLGVSADALTRLYYPDGSYKMVGASMVISETSQGATLSLEKQKVTLYTPDGQTTTVFAAEAEEKKEQGWYEEPVRMMYTPDGRSSVILLRETKDYLEVGWYLYPVCNMYAADGRTIVIKKEEVDAYKEQGWYENPVITLYKPGDETLVVEKTEMESSLNKGWYTEPVTHMYAIDGRSIVIKKTEVEAYQAEGWYTEPHITVYKGEESKIIKKSELGTFEKQGWSLVPSKYIEFIDHDLEIDFHLEMSRIQKEMREMMAAEKQSQKMLEEAFRGIGYGID